MPNHTPKNILGDRYETHWKGNPLILTTPISHKGINTPTTNLESKTEDEGSTR